MAPTCPASGCSGSAEENRGKCELLIASYILAGFAMMLNIRLSYSSAPYALIRFQLPENLFSVFVRRMASSLELWCLPGFFIADIIEHVVKGVATAAPAVTTSDDQLKAKAGAQSSEGLRQLASELYDAANELANTGATDGNAASNLADAVGQDENAVGSLREKLKELAAPGSDLTTKASDVRDKYRNVKPLFNKVKEKQYSAYNDGDKPQKYQAVEAAWNTFNNLYLGTTEIKFWLIIIPSIIAQWLNFLTYVILFFVYRGGGDQGRLTTFYWTIAVSGFVFGINNPLVFAADYYYIAIYIAGENCFPALTSFIHYLTTLMFGNRRKYNSDYLIVYIDICVAILISFAAAILWTLGYGVYKDGKSAGTYKHIFTFGFGTGSAKPSLIAPLLMVLVGMGLVYAIYPGIAPGMIVPFYLIDKIEMVLLIATIVPALSIAMVNQFNYDYSPKYYEGWEANWGYHFFDLVVPIMIILATIFIYSLHYRDSNLSRAIINQPKMSTALTIVFYMCHEISLAVGFAGMVGNGPEYTVIAQMVGAFIMVFLALYSEGYIIEYKSHNPDHWQTERMWYLYGYYQLNPDFLL